MGLVDAVRHPHALQGYSTIRVRERVRAVVWVGAELEAERDLEGSAGRCPEADAELSPKADAGFRLVGDAAVGPEADVDAERARV